MIDTSMAVAERMAQALGWERLRDPEILRTGVWRRETMPRTYPWGQIIAWTLDDPCARWVTPCPGVGIDIFTTDHSLAAAHLGINLESKIVKASLRGGNSTFNRLVGLDDEHRCVIRRIDDALDGLVTYALRNAGDDAALEWLFGQQDSETAEL